jgi:hypothetical protein
MKFLNELKNLKLPPEQFAVFGSGPLAIRGLREANDLDIIVTKKLWNKLIEKYNPTEKGNEIIISNISIFQDWKPWFSEIETLIKGADIIDEIRYVKLDKVMKWKQNLNREKDQKDIQLIKKYLKIT